MVGRYVQTCSESSAARLNIPISLHHRDTEDAEIEQDTKVSKKPSPLSVLRDLRDYAKRIAPTAEHKSAAPLSGSATPSERASSTDHGLQSRDHDYKPPT